MFVWLAWDGAWTPLWFCVTGVVAGFFIGFANGLRDGLALACMGHMLDRLDELEAETESQTKTSGRDGV